MVDETFVCRHVVEVEIFGDNVNAIFKNAYGTYEALTTSGKILGKLNTVLSKKQPVSLMVRWPIGVTYLIGAFGRVCKSDWQKETSPQDKNNKRCRIQHGDGNR